MKIHAIALQSLVEAAREIGEQEVTLPYQDGTITIRFNAPVDKKPRVPTALVRLPAAFAPR